MAMSQATGSTHCSACADAITDNDFASSNFVIDTVNGLKHKQCPNPNHFPALWRDKYVSNESQYSHQSAGSCTINALEIALRLQCNEKPSVSLINNVLSMASLYTSSMHTGVSDILPHVTRYNTTLKSVDWMQCSVKKIRTLIDQLDKNAKNSKNDVSCVITKPPESIFLHRVYQNKQYILYDSHPRPEKGLNGSHLLIFPDIGLLNEYLCLLFPFVDLNGDYGLYGDMMNQCEATYIQIDYDKYKNEADLNNLKENIIHNVDYDQMSKDLGLIGFKLQKEYVKNNNKNKNIFSKIKGFGNKVINKVKKNENDKTDKNNNSVQSKECKENKENNEVKKNEKNERKSKENTERKTEENNNNNEVINDVMDENKNKEKVNVEIKENKTDENDANDKMENEQNQNKDDELMECDNTEIGSASNDKCDNTEFEMINVSNDTINKSSSFIKVHHELDKSDESIAKQ